MRFIIRNLAVSVRDTRSPEQLVSDTLGISAEQVRIERQAIDARRKPIIRYVYHLSFNADPTSAAVNRFLRSDKIAPYTKKPLSQEQPLLHLNQEPLVIGFGPAGMFTALELARKGYKPIVFERGPRVRERIVAIEKLWTHGILDPEANMQFGEGGAGTFSDGKLTTGKTRPLDRHILKTFVEFGAPEEILYRHKPHIGTDNLRKVVVNIRHEIEHLGGQVLFNHRLENIETAANQLRAVTINNTRYQTDTIILAIGHSSRDTLHMLREAGVAMEPKPYAIGTRIEHPVDLINIAQYGPDAAVLPAADYKLTYHDKAGSAFTFCMCPGGQVVCAASESGGQVSNGMSFFQRDGDYSNAAIVVSVDPSAMGQDADTAIAAQVQLEQRFFQAGGSNYCAATQLAQDFCTRTPSQPSITTTYQPGNLSARLDQLLPERIAYVLQGALQRWNRSIPGFIEHGVLIGLESRTSSPLRIPRDSTYCAESLQGLYMLGEGAGYAGGIMTCARDACRFVRLVHPVSESS